MTAQTRDILLYNSEELYMSAEPLESYLKTIKLRHELVAPTTACWRGYYSKWAIDNKKLYLIDWEGYIQNYQKVGIDYIFPGEAFVFAKWYTGTITIPTGELVNYIHGGYASIFEGERFLEFENGCLINEYEKWLTKEEIESILRKEKEMDDFPF